MLHLNFHFAPIFALQCVNEERGRKHRINNNSNSGGGCYRLHINFILNYTLAICMHNKRKIFAIAMVIISLFFGRMGVWVSMANRRQLFATSMIYVTHDRQTDGADNFRARSVSQPEKKNTSISVFSADVESPEML